MSARAALVIVLSTGNGSLVSACKQSIRCCCRISSCLNLMRVGSSPDARERAYAIANKPQSVPPCCCCTLCTLTSKEPLFVKYRAWSWVWRSVASHPLYRLSKSLIWVPQFFEQTQWFPATWCIWMLSDGSLGSLSGLCRRRVHSSPCCCGYCCLISWTARLIWSLCRHCPLQILSASYSSTNIWLHNISAINTCAST